MQNVEAFLSGDVFCKFLCLSSYMGTLKITDDSEIVNPCRLVASGAYRHYVIIVGCILGGSWDLGILPTYLR